MIDELSEATKVGLYMVGVLGELKSRDLIGGGWDCTPKGTAMFDQLKASGFVPSEQHREQFLQFAGFHTDGLKAARILVNAYIEGYDFDAHPGGASA